MLEPEIVESVWIPGDILDLTAGSLRSIAAAQCPWAFLIIGAVKALKKNQFFGPAEVMRRNLLPMFDRVTSKQFTLKTALLAYKKLSLFVSSLFIF